MIIDRVDAEKLPSRIVSDTATQTDRSMVSPEDRIESYAQAPMTYWITGLHASGKNEIGYRLEKYLFDQGKKVVVLDGNRLRSGLNKELGHDKVDRDENLRRVAEMVKVLNDQGLVVIAIFISPDKDTRLQVKDIIGTDRYKEIFIDTSIEICKQRDKKQLYKQAESGLLKHFPGVDVQYEVGLPELTITNLTSVKISELI